MLGLLLQEPKIDASLESCRRVPVWVCTESFVPELADGQMIVRLYGIYELAPGWVTPPRADQSRPLSLDDQLFRSVATVPV